MIYSKATQKYRLFGKGVAGLLPKALILTLVVLAAAPLAAKPKFCQTSHELAVDRNRVTICTPTPFSRRKQIELLNAIIKTEFIYGTHRKLKSFLIPTHVTVIFTDQIYLNDGTVTGRRSRKNNTVGLYVKGTNTVYIAIEAHRDSNSVFTHEYIHLLNDLNGVHAEDLDEALAYKLEHEG